MPIKIRHEITKIFINTSKGNDVGELTWLTTTSTKPGRSEGSSENLRPMLSLSILRKLLTTCMVERT